MPRRHVARRGGAWPRAVSRAALRRRPLGRELIAARVAELLILRVVDLVGLGENLTRDPLVVVGRLRRGVRQRGCRPH